MRIEISTKTDTSQPFAETKFLEIKGRRMAYIDGGDVPAIVFLHGSPTSSYLWRNVMPACWSLGRFVACDVIGVGSPKNCRIQGRSEKRQALIYRLLYNNVN